MEIIERGRAAGERAVPELHATLDRRLASYLGTASCTDVGRAGAAPPYGVTRFTTARNQGFP